MPALFIFGAFGLIVGSFLNVVILRFGERSIGGRSACSACGMQLGWYDLIPVFSWLALSGRCRSCHERISIQYPLVEAATAIFFSLIAGAGLPLYTTAVALVIISILICIFVYDLRHKLIPDLWVGLFCVCALVFAFTEFNTSYFIPHTSYILIAGPVAALPILFLWALSYPFVGFAGAWMGFGDVKLALGIGWLLAVPTSIGLPLGFLAIMFAFIIGATVSVCILLPLPYFVQWWHTLRGRAHAAKAASLRPVAGIGIGSNVDDQTLPTTASPSDHAAFAAGYTMRSEVPFGPFLVASCVLLWFAVLYNISIPFL
ncbi:MAG TPA: prepilin peptidase [Candidatus Paceibacterota bacterium]